MPIAQQITSGRVPVKIWTPSVEGTALKQLQNLASLPIIHGHIAAMPDVHAGIGATVGSVIPTKGAIVPSAVGVDCGCGMNAVQLSLTANDLPESLAKIRRAIEHAVPVGFDTHSSADVGDEDRKRRAKELQQGLARIVQKNGAIATMQKDFRETWLRQLGTLGGGNHFIEICLDESDRYGLLDRLANPGQRLGKVARGERKLHGVHAAVVNEYAGC